MKTNCPESNRDPRAGNALSPDATTMASSDHVDRPPLPSSKPESPEASTTGIGWRFERADVRSYIPAQTLLGNEVYAFRFYLQIRKGEATPGALDFGIYWARDTGQTLWTCPFERPFFPGPMRFQYYRDLVEWVIEVIQIRTKCSREERDELQLGFENLIFCGDTPTDRSSKTAPTS